MGEILRIDGLCKRYSDFALKDVSFRLEEGYIMGFIGRNGAGKTTTIKSMLNMVHSDGGSVRILGRDYIREELYLRGKIGVVMGGVDYYPHKKLQTMASVTKRFYPQWDDAAFAMYLQKFGLNPQKRVQQLSQGMRVKFALAMALSHDAKLLILDEPTSGLDPVSRDELLEIFQNIIRDGERSIVFSTHITSDLEKCADYITYIRAGSILASCDREEFLSRWKLLRGTGEISEALQSRTIGFRRGAYGFDALINAEDAAYFPKEYCGTPTLEEIMIHMERA